MVDSSPSTAAEALVVHAETLCESHDHIRDVVGNLSIPVDQLEDRRRTASVRFETAPLVRVLLYKEIRGFTQARLIEELERTSNTLTTTLGLPELPTQQTLSHAWRNFSPATQRTIKAAARGIAAELQEAGIAEYTLAPPSLDDDDDGDSADDVNT